MKKNNLLLSVCLLAVLMFSSNHIVSAQEESSATSEETLKLIENLIDDPSLYYNENESKGYIFLAETPCSFMVMENHTLTRNDSFKTGRRTFSIVNLADIDPVSLKIDTTRDSFKGQVEPTWYDIYLETTGYKKTIQERTEEYKYDQKNKKDLERTEKSKNMISKAVVVTRNKDNAPRIVKALKHAIKVCGGKAPPF
jgi:hypothetical protein